MKMERRMSDNTAADVPDDLRPQPEHPFRLLLTTVCVIVIADALFELSALFRPIMSTNIEALLNEGFLLLVVLPLVYFTLFRPMNRIIRQYRSTLGEVKTLRGLILICAECKKIRTDAQSWVQIESYVAKHTEATFSHGFCDDCIRKLYPEDADHIFQKRNARSV